MVLIIIPFETITLIDIMFANGFGHAVSISFPFPISNDTRTAYTRTEFGTGLRTLCNQDETLSFSLIQLLDYTFADAAMHFTDISRFCSS